MKKTTTALFILVTGLLGMQALALSPSPAPLNSKSVAPEIQISDPSQSGALAKTLSSCSDPTNLAGSAVSQTGVSLSWDSTGTGANSFDVEYGPLGYTAGSGTQTSVNGASTTLTGLPVNLCQDFYVRSVCGPNDTGAWVGPVNVCPAKSLCDSMDQYDSGLIAPQSSLIYGWYGGNGGSVDISTAQASSGSQSMYIPGDGTSDVVAWFDTIDSGLWKFAFDIYVPSGTEAYYNFQRNYSHGDPNITNVWAFDVNFLSGGTATVDGGSFGSTNVASFSYNPGQWNTLEHIIDFDNDSVYIQINGNPTNAGWTYSFNNNTLPVQCNGINFFSNPNLVNPDYYVDNLCISPYTFTCDPPSSLDTASVGCETAQLTWDEGRNSQIEYGPVGFNLGAGTTLSASSPHTLSGLSPGNSYEFYVFNICRGDTSAISGPFSFTTPTGPLAAAFTANFGQATNSDQPVTFDASSSLGANSYIWNFGDGFVGNGSNPTHTYTSNGSYVVQLEIEGPCGKDTITDTLVVDAINLSEYQLNRNLSVYPSPAQDFVNVEFPLNDGEGVHLRLTDLQGREIISRQVQDASGQFSHRLNVQELASGVYLLEITIGSKTARRKINLH